MTHRANRKKRLTVLYIVEHPNQEGDTCIAWTSQYCWTNGWNCLWRGHSVYRNRPLIPLKGRFMGCKTFPKGHPLVKPLRHCWSLRRGGGLLIWIDPYVPLPRPHGTGSVLCPAALRLGLTPGVRASAGVVKGVV